MEDLKQLRASRHAHRSQLTKTLSSITETVEGHDGEPLTEFRAVTLTTTLEQLQRRKDILTNLDGKIAFLIDDEKELDADIYECEDIQSNVIEKIAQLQFFLRSRKSRPLPLVLPSETPSTSVPPSSQLILHRPHKTEKALYAMQTMSHVSSPLP